MLRGSLGKKCCAVGPYIVCCLLIIAAIALRYKRNNGKRAEVESVATKISETPSPSVSTSNNKICLIRLNESDAQCMDGSNGGFYLRKGKGEGQHKWHVHFEGGGWCHSFDQCRKRMETHLGSSNLFQPCIEDSWMQYYLSSSSTENPLLFNWNTALVKYCDGSSYSGDAVWREQDQNIVFKGNSIRYSVISTLLRLGMNRATDVLISGCSAGALGVYLGIDQMNAQIRQDNPHARVRGFADSGYFMDHVGRGANYVGDIQKVYRFANMTAGVPKACVQEAESNAVKIDASRSLGKSIEQETSRSGQSQSGGGRRLQQRNDTSRRQPTTRLNSEVCVFAPHVVNFIKTPMFAFQPQYDRWQLWHVVGDDSNIPLINEFGANLTRSMMKNFLSKPGNGATGCSAVEENVWNGNRIRIYKGGKAYTPATAFVEWYQQSLREDENLHDYLVRDLLWFQNAPFPCGDCCLCT